MVTAVVARSAGKPVELCELSLPDVGPEQVRVRIAAAGVCHSDLSLINGTLAPQFPVILGHEAAGVVVEVGDRVGSVVVGDHVVLNWAPACRRCWFCLHGEPWLCEAVEGVVSPPGGHLGNGEPAHLAFGLGAFAEEVVVGAHAVVAVPDDVPLAVAALLGCAALTGIGAVRNTADVRAGESVLVMGMGGIGLSAVAGTRLSGASRIIAVDLNPDKEEVARAMGATDFLTAGKDMVKQVRTLTGGRGADHAFECVGAAATIRDAWRSVRRGGRCTVVGVGPRNAVVEFNALELFHMNRTLGSSVYGSADPDRDIPILVEQIRLGQLDLGALVTDTIGLDGVQAAFERMQQGQGVRSVIVLGES